MEFHYQIPSPDMEMFDVSILTYSYIDFQERKLLRQQNNNFEDAIKVCVEIQSIRKNKFQASSLFAFRGNKIEIHRRGSSVEANDHMIILLLIQVEGVY